jgi:hypothetical protein
MQTVNKFIYFKITINHHNCLQYERVLHIFYFHILSSFKFHKIYLWWSPLEQNHKIEKNITAS